ncbi:MAG: hypothetical protein ABSA85_01900 [Terracidiphilus sp.]|jgi:hypothetical protein
MTRTLFAFLILCGASQLLNAQPGIGAQYFTRDPITCSSKKAPASGAPSPAQAALYVRCDPSGEGLFGGNLFLLENVKVEIGSGRPFQPGSDIGMFQIDIRQPVYPIRGSFLRYQCSSSKASPYKRGSNCILITTPQAAGACFKTTFGDWTCKMASVNPSSDIQLEQMNVGGPQ